MRKQENSILHFHLEINFKALFDKSIHSKTNKIYSHVNIILHFLKNYTGYSIEDGIQVC